MAECDLDMVIAEQNMIANHEEIWHQKYEKQLRDKDDTIAALVKVLQKVEWGAHPNYFGTQYCPSCHMARIAGHTDECKLADALEATDG